METGTDMVPVNQLKQGPEQESELSASIEQCLSLAQEILASIDKALSKAQSGGCPNLAVGPPDSPPSPRSPRSEITSQQPFEAEGTEMISKKRKTQPKWTSRVKLGAGPEAEGPLDDGYIWRKYGQKKKQGAKYPRGYYRCTQRHPQGCLATKQVQRSDDNPAIFNVTYVGTHTCNQKLSPPAAATSSKWTSLMKFGSWPEAEGPLDDGYTWRKYGQKDIWGAKYPRAYYRCTHCHSQGCLAKKQVQQSDDNPAIFDVTYEGTHTCDQKPSPPADAASSCSSPPSTLDNSGKHSFTKAFTSSVTSELNCFSSSLCRESSHGETPSPQASESFAVTVPALESGNNSSVFDLDFPFDLDSDTEVPF